jgi:hypothetical protein
LCYKGQVKPLRTLSARPEIVVDNQGFRLVDPADNSQVGIPGPFGRQRIVTAIPTNDSETGPVQLTAHVALHDAQLFYLGDPDGNLIGIPAIWVHRMLSARWTQDTRRLT